jgi:pyrimidine operon attenuation protein/uracil phosphoribosyltransferase
MHGYILLIYTQYKPIGMPETEKNYILNADAAVKKMKRMAFEILENNADEDHIVFAGIAENGLVVAKSIAAMYNEISGRTSEVLSLTLDKRHPSEVVMDRPLDLNGKVVILVDDVTNSGKTLTYALKPLLNAYPKKIQTLVMVERSHKKFPVHPDYVGLSLSTFLHEHIFVEVGDGAVQGAYVV